MSTRLSRRAFVKLSSAAASLAASDLAHGMAPSPAVAIALDPSCPVAQSEPVAWAARKLRESLTARGITLDSPHPSLTIQVAAPGAPLAGGFPVPAALTAPESLALIPGPSGGPATLLATGADIRGVTYALLELADRVQRSNDPFRELHLSVAVTDATPNRVRSVARAFLSEVEDKPWFYDRAFWSAYLDTLASARFNRFNFALGFGWDFPRGVTGDYLHFPYPYLVELPAYPGVHVDPPLQPGERQRNLEALQFIAAETARRGMQFQLGLWTHAYQWTDSPHSDHHILGLTPETHAAYCRDALAALLAACPQITGLSMRIHGESGIPEGSYGFWQTLFEAVPAARTPDGKPRVIEFDLHAKGLDQRMIEIARATGMPVKTGAKFWAEHQGLGYHQADIRATEYPRQGVTGTFAVSSGARNFTRYGYGDFYQQGIGLELLYRVWPGTQRHLLWADPALAAGYGHAAHFCGAAGMELCEPLTFKGREGSGHPGGRLAYANPALASPTGKLPDCDTNKFALTYLTWGRHLYNPETAADAQQASLRSAYGPAGAPLGEALAASSRILPLITTAWLPSASNHELWVENITPVSLLPYTTRPLFTDSPAPHNVSAISPLDPQLFTTIAQHADNLATGKPDPRYNTSEVVAWLEGFVRTSSTALAQARTAAGRRASSSEFRRAEEDILILNGLGTYFANLFRAALFYSLHEQTGDPAAATQCLSVYRAAREAWAAMATRAQTVYKPDISYGASPFRRGHWADRLPALDADLSAVEKHLAQAASLKSSASNALKQIATPVARPTLAAIHNAPDTFHPGADLPLIVSAPAAVTEAVLWYRHVNHGERWLSTAMQSSGGTHTAAIPAAYTSSPYPLQYYFELRSASAATLHPAFNPTLSNQPYYAVYKRA